MKSKSIIPLVVTSESVNFIFAVVKSEVFMNCGSKTSPNGLRRCILV